MNVVFEIYIYIRSLKGSLVPKLVKYNCLRFKKKYIHNKRINRYNIFDDIVISGILRKVYNVICQKKNIYLPDIVKIPLFEPAVDALFYVFYEGNW